MDDFMCQIQCDEFESENINFEEILKEEYDV